jgi:hypothetical protein
LAVILVDLINPYPIVSQHLIVKDTALSFAQVFDYLLSNEPKIEFNNVIVRYDVKTDREAMDQRWLNKNEPIKRTASPIIVFNKCVFDNRYWFVFRNIDFQQLYVDGCEGTVRFKGCNFTTFRTIASTFQFLRFERCNFNGGFESLRSSFLDDIGFKNCRFVNQDSIYQEISPDGFEEPIGLFRIVSKNTAIEVNIEGCYFDTKTDSMRNKERNFIRLTGSNFTNLKCVSSTINTALDLSGSSVTTSVTFYDNQVNAPFLIDAFSPNPANFRLEWSSISEGKIAAFDVKSQKFYNRFSATTTSDTLSIYWLNILQSCYSTIFKGLRSHNLSMANAAYIEWKNIETANKGLQDWSLQHPRIFFEYYTNRLLRWFCDYGTNYLKALKVSGEVILIFACLYFFIPNRFLDPDVKRIDFFERLTSYLRYFSEHTSLVSIHRQLVESKNVRGSLDEYRQQYEAHKSNIPPYFGFFAKPHNWGRAFWQNIRERIYGRIDQFPAKWVVLSKKERQRAALMFAFVISFAAIVSLLRRFLEALTLSLNVFSTLGFGANPATGIPRYLCVLEGFVGWLLLSLFSVSLISQIIQ